MFPLHGGTPAAQGQDRRPEASTGRGSRLAEQYADFTAGLKRELAEIQDAKIRQWAIYDMRAVLESDKKVRGERAARRR